MRSKTSDCEIVRDFFPSLFWMFFLVVNQFWNLMLGTSTCVFETVEPSDSFAFRLFQLFFSQFSRFFVSCTWFSHTQNKQEDPTHNLTPQMCSGTAAVAGVVKEEWYAPPRMPATSHRLHIQSLAPIANCPHLQNHYNDHYCQNSSSFHQSIRKHLSFPSNLSCCCPRTPKFPKDNQSYSQRLSHSTPHPTSIVCQVILCFDFAIIMLRMMKWAFLFIFNVDWWSSNALNSPFIIFEKQIIRQRIILFDPRASKKI